MCVCVSIEDIQICPYHWLPYWTLAETDSLMPIIPPVAESTLFFILHIWSFWSSRLIQQLQHLRELQDNYFALGAWDASVAPPMQVVGLEIAFFRCQSQSDPWQERQRDRHIAISVRVRKPYCPHLLNLSHPISFYQCQKVLGDRQVSVWYQSQLQWWTI